MKGKLSIGKVTCYGSLEEDYISIAIEDSLSSIQFVSVKVDLVTFTKALFGLGHVPIEFETRGLERVGKKLEYKTEDVVIPSAPNRIGLTDKDIDESVGCYEVDGWIGSREDCKNYHRHVRTAKTYQVFTVHFHRWVDVVDENLGDDHV